ncbi:MAG TPA: CPBP family intramembrane glutamic endopeptidase [Candidatus Saccharimonadales bacterium]|nr:CPBP family intramembrane glutamic endopeptidase [Candidatus Saccharimonadales bacterium]
MSGEKVSYAQGFWIFGGYYVTRILIAAIFAIGTDRFFLLSTESARLIGAYVDLLGEVLAGAVAWLLIRNYYSTRVYGRDLSGIGLGWSSWGALCLSVVGGAVLGAGAVLFSCIFSSGSRVDSSPLGLYISQGRALLCAWIMVGIMVAPLVEEMLYRGVALSILAVRWGRLAGVAGSSALFITAHLPQVLYHGAAVLAISVLGVACACMRVAGCSLWSAILFHGAYNAFLSGWILFKEGS